MIIRLLLPLILMLNTCDLITQEMATEQQKKELMSRATFDQNVIGHLAEYQQLALLLKKNKDTLIAYRYASNNAIVIGGGKRERFNDIR